MNKHRDFSIKFKKFTTNGELGSITALLNNIYKNECKREDIVTEILWKEENIKEIDKKLRIYMKTLSDVFGVKIKIKEVKINGWKTKISSKKR